MLSHGHYWLIAFCGLLATVLLFGAAKAGRLHRMPVYFPAFICLCGGILLALSGRLALQSPAPSARADLLWRYITWLRVLVILLLVYIIGRWARPPKEHR